MLEQCVTILQSNFLHNLVFAWGNSAYFTLVYPFVKM